MFPLKSKPLAIKFFISSLLVLGGLEPVVAQSVSIGQVNGISLDSMTGNSLGFDLSYPNASQRFFEAGQNKFEQGIQSFEQIDSSEAAPTLTIQPNIREGIEDLGVTFNSN